MDTPMVLSVAGIIISTLLAFLVSSIRIGVYKNKVDNACNDVQEMKKELKEVRDMAISCTTSLKEREPLVRKKSPIELSDRGKIVLAESGGRAFIDNNYAELRSKLEEKKPETAYDIQEAAKAVVEEIKEDKRLNPIKEYLFKEGMAIEEIMVVLGIYLRDMVLHERGINSLEIDKPKDKDQESI